MKRFFWAIGVILLSSFLFLPQNHAYSAGKAALQAKEDIKPEERSAVCMVTDRVPGDRVMIPVAVEGKTYYGCCPVCVKRLLNDRAIRYSIDPVTGREVDKSTAFILAGPEKKALYFESKESALKYRALLTTKRIMQ